MARKKERSSANGTVFWYGVAFARKIKQKAKTVILDGVLGSVYQATIAVDLSGQFHSWTPLHLDIGVADSR